MSYECHITSMTAHAPRLAELAERSGWKTSEIARDPVLGDDTYFYLTKHSHDFPEIFVAMTNMATVLEANDIPVVRKKIELIVYDTKK